MAALVVVAPELVSFWVRAPLMGRDRALQGSTQWLAWIPGLIGQYLRRAFLTQVLDYMHPTAVVEFGTIFSKCGCRLDENTYIGPRCHIGLVHLEKDVLIAAGVHIPSGGQTHGTGSTALSIRDQPGQPRRVHIGAGTWVGSAAVVMADIGPDTVVGAGAVVSKPLPAQVVAVGAPARVIRSRAAVSARNEL
jgi:acetyltransferase-like isoleucine patch superfamily enzyme